MLKNYVKIALRNLLRQKSYSLINVVGLAVGMACCLLILLFVRHELSYDRFHDQADQIYRVALKRLYPNHETFYAVTQAPLAPTMKIDYPEVIDATRLFRVPGSVNLRYQDKQFEEQRYLFADSNFFDVFSFTLLRGNPETALARPNSIILTQANARKYFGDDEPIGKVINNGNNDLTVTGVVADPPGNSHLQFDAIASLISTGLATSQNWISFATHSYIVLQPGTSPDALQAKLPQMAEKYIGPQIHGRLQMSFAEYQAAGNGYEYFLQPITDIHLHSQLENEIAANGDITYVYAFTAISIFILLIACINFMNLATARSAGRAREVGIRKVLGSYRSQLVRQFLLESLLLTFVAALLAIVIVEIAFPYFADLAGRNITNDLLYSPVLLPGLFGFAVLVGLLSGSYPAFFLSAFRPIAVLRGKLESGGGSNLRNVLVVLQFGISIVFIVGTLVVQGQLRFVQTKNLGFDKEQLIVVENAFFLQDKAEAFDNTIRQQAGVVGVSGTSALPGGFFPGEMFQPRGVHSENLTTRFMVVDHDFIETMGMRMIAGRSFSRQFPSDSLAIILNQTAVRDLGFDEPVGRQVVRPDDGKLFTIIGVIEDFHFQTLHHDISSLVLMKRGTAAGNFTAARIIRVQPDFIDPILAHLQKTWSELVPAQPFKYSFFDETFAAAYSTERTTGRIFAIFAGLAIFIACLGLFGLAAFTTQQRTREIGVRKVLGASVTSILFLLSRDFSKLVLIAFVLASPLAYFAMQGWLSNFAYRISLTPFFFLGAGLVALLIAWLTVSYQAIRAALINPVIALKHE